MTASAFVTDTGGKSRLLTKNVLRWRGALVAAEARSVHLALVGRNEFRPLMDQHGLERNDAFAWSNLQSRRSR